MKNILILVASFLIACSAWGEKEPHFAPGIVTAIPSKKQKTPDNKINSKSLCDKRKGVWYESKEYEYKYCVLLYPDAGKLCQVSADCVGHCTWPLDEKQQDGKPLPKGYGICQLDDSTDDCGRPHFERGVITYFKCD